MQITRQIDFFCREYVTDFDASRAARAAGVTRSSAPTKAKLWLSDATVNARIDELYAAKVAKIPDVVMSPQEVLVRLSKIAAFDTRVMVDDDGKALDLNEVGEDPATVIESYKGPTYEIDRNGDAVATKPAEFKTPSRLNALKMLGEHHNVFEKHEKNKAANVSIVIEGKDALA